MYLVNIQLISSSLEHILYYSKAGIFILSEEISIYEVSPLLTFTVTGSPCESESASEHAALFAHAGSTSHVMTLEIRFSRN